MSFESDGQEPAPPARGRWALIGIAAAIVLVAAFVGGGLLAPYIRGGKPAPVSPAAASTERSPSPPPALSAEPAKAVGAEPGADARPRPRRKAAEPSAPAAPAPPAAPTTGELHIDSDVPGAMVFLDRVYLGTAPVTAPNVAPGPHHLNASADGYDGISQPIDVVAGPADVVVRFKEVRLKESLDVVHKHGMGSCEGRLLADPQGVRYETANKDDAFSIKFAEIETFEVDYLKKNLRIKRRGGKTWNFTTRTENADPLFVFHRNVDKVRQKMK